MLRSDFRLNEPKKCGSGLAIPHARPNIGRDCVKSQFFENVVYKINNLQSPYTLKTGFAPSLALQATAYSARLCLAPASSRA